jgi:hypothetical protein
MEWEEINLNRGSNLNSKEPAEPEFRYGDNGTIHGSTEVNVELDEYGQVVAVWYRCMMLPFTQRVCSPNRAHDMRSAYEQPARPIKAIVFKGPI